MKRALILGLVVCFWFLAVPVCQAQELEIVVGADNSFPPFEYVDNNGVPVGYTVDLISAVAKEMGLRVRIVAGPWQEIRQQFDRGKIDVLAGMFYSRQRASSVDFSIPHSWVTYSIFVRKGEHKVGSAVDLKGLDVRVQQDDIASELLAAQGVQAKPVVDTQTALDMLSRGQGAAVVAAKPVGYYVLQQRGIRNIEIAADLFQHQQYCFAVHRDRKDDLLHKLNEGLTVVKLNGVQQRVAERWLSRWEPQGVEVTRVLLVVGVLAGLLVLAFAWSWTLRRRVRDRTVSLQIELAERQRAEQRILTLNRLYVVTTEINKAIVRAQDRDTLFQDVCRLIAEHGRVPLTWIGLIEEETHRIIPLAFAGNGSEYLRNMRLSTLAEVPEGRGPAGIAAREGKPSIANDIQSEDRMLPWRTMAMKHGYHSAAAFPLHVHGKVAGILAFYAPQPYFFNDEDEIALLSGVAADISFALEVLEREKQRKHAEKALKESEEHFRTVFEQSSMGMVLVNRETCILAANSAFCAMLGYSLDELRGLELESPVLTYADDLQHSRELTLKVAHRELSPAEWEKRFLHKSGQPVWGHIVFNALRDANGDVKYYLAQVQNVTARKQAEADLREVNWKLEAMLDASPVAIVALDPQGRVTAWNKASEQMFGWTEAEVLGSPHPIVPVEGVPEHREMVEVVLRGVVFSRRELKRKRKDGTPLDVSLSVAPLRDAEGRITGVLAVYADETERKRLEAQLLQSQKLESVGRLAGGVAHDFNNLLTVINCYSDLLLSHSETHPSLRNAIEEIRKAGEQASGLTRQLLAFSRRQVLQPKVFSLNDAVQDLHQMLQRLMGEDIEFVVDLYPALGNVKADPGQIQQVIMNLAVNARDAMPSGGKLILRTCNVDEQAFEGESSLDGPRGQEVMLAVTDTGVGMDEETQRRIFEPFFTTKEAGKGTGLGLSMVWGIVNQSGGHISVHSELGRGTTFQLFLPRVEEPAQQEPALQETPVASGTETILLVEDQPQLRQLTSHILRGYGYKVLEAANGADALSVCRQKGKDVDLVLTDIVMPGVTGIELGKRLRAVSPKLKILYMSGYTDDVILRQGPLEQGAAYLEKPFTPQGLAAKLREVLGSPDGGH